ncbi:MAG: ComEC family competence protein [Oscillospiraceae bacterium]|jgi:competence protein ComEC|nr:ComEC family competence protein [Oscillospiraceae bacterium]
MKRLFAIIGFTYLITLTIFTFAPADWYWVFLSFFVVFEIFSLIFKNARKDKVLPTIFLSCIVASCGYLINYYNFIVPTQTLYDKDLTVTGKICELPYKQDDKFYYILNVENIKEAPDSKNFKMAISSYEALPSDIYDNVTVSIHTYSYNNFESNTFKQYNFSKKIYLSGYLLEYTDSPVIINDSDHSSLYYYSLNIRRNIMSLYRRMFSGEYSSVVNGIIFGDRHNMPDRIKNNFLSSGVYHILAVSGVHVTIISQMILSILLRFRINKRLSAILSAAGVFLFMSVSCFTPSVVRAGIMSIIYLIGLAIHRQSDSLNSLGISILIISFINPNIGGSISLWLSFLSTLGIIVLHPKVLFYLQKSFKTENKVIKYILESVSLTVSVILFTLPLCAVVFKKIYLSAFISNMLILPFIPLLIFNSFICVILYVLFPIPIWKLSGIVNLCIIKYMDCICGFLAKISFLRIFLGYHFIELFLLISILVLGITFISDKFRKYVKIVLLSISNILVILCLCSRFFEADDVVVSVLDSSDNFSAVLSKNRKNIVIYCCGDYPKYKDISDYLYNINSYKLDFFILPGFDSEHFKTVNKVMDEYGAKYMIVPDKYEFDEEARMVNSFKCQKYLFDKSFRFSVYNDINVFVFKVENKPWLYMEVYDKKILCCLEGGDILKIPEKFRNASILISSGLPNNFSDIKGIKDIIFCSNKKAYSTLKNKINYHNINNFYAGTSGNVKLRFKKTGMYKIAEGN